MNTTVNILLLHIMMLATQAFYMYLSNKAQMKSKRYYYLMAIPFVAAFPAFLNDQDPHIYSIYEYAIVFCIFGAAITDVVIAALYNREYLTESTCRRLFYSYLMICTVVSFCGSIDFTVRIAMILILTGAILTFLSVKKLSVSEVLKAVPLATLSIICSWAFVKYIF